MTLTINHITVKSINTMSDLKNLEILKTKLTKLTPELNEEKCQDVQTVIQRFNYYRNEIILPLRNQHFISCVWSNEEFTDQLTSTDFCSCYYIERFPRKMCIDIVDKFGLEYMLHF